MPTKRTKVSIHEARCMFLMMLTGNLCSTRTPAPPGSSMSRQQSTIATKTSSNLRTTWGKVIESLLCVSIILNIYSQHLPLMMRSWTTPIHIRYIDGVIWSGGRKQRNISRRSPWQFGHEAKHNLHQLMKGLCESFRRSKT